MKRRDYSQNQDDTVLRQDLLGLPGWAVESVEETGTILKLTVRPPPPTVCQAKSGEESGDAEQGTGGEQKAGQPKRCRARKLKAPKKPLRDNLVVRDIPIRGMPVELHVIRHRYRCPNCGGIFSWRPPEIHPTRPVTHRLATWIWERALRRPFADVAEDVGVHRSTVLRNFMAEYRRREENPKRRRGRPSKLSWLGIDEVYLLSIKRSQQVRKERGGKEKLFRKEPQCILTDAGTGRVIDLLKDRELDTVRKALRRLKAQGYHPELVTMDMWTNYRKAVYEVLGEDTAIVVDKFHVVQMIKKAFKKVRIETESELRKKAARAGQTETEKLDAQRAGIQRYSKLLLSPPRLIEMLEDGGEEMKDILKEQVLLMDARTATQSLLGIYRLRSPSAAADYYESWKDSLDVRLHKYFEKGVFAQFEQWGREILNYWDYRRATNAYTEAANGRLKLRRRVGAGYKFETYRALALYGVSRRRS